MKEDSWPTDLKSRMEDISTVSMQVEKGVMNHFTWNLHLAIILEGMVLALS